MENGEHLAFEHAAALCKEYREENKHLKKLIKCLSISLICTFFALGGVIGAVIVYVR